MVRVGAVTQSDLNNNERHLRCGETLVWEHERRERLREVWPEMDGKMLEEATEEMEWRGLRSAEWTEGYGEAKRWTRWQTTECRKGVWIRKDVLRV